MTMKTFYTYFAKQAAQNPSSIAVITKVMGQYQHFTYAEIKKRVDDLARYLLTTYDSDIYPVNIGVYLDRSIDWVVAILAVWKVGFTYVPIGTDERYTPDIRIQSITTHCGLRVILTNQQLHRRLEYLVPIPLLSLDTLSLPKDNLYPTSINPKPINEQSIAYILYTSGSTGTPKGVAIGHAGIPFCASSMNRILGVNKQDVIAQFAGTTFDASICEIIMAFQAGASLFIVPDDERLDMEQLAASYRSCRVSVAIFTPTFLRQAEPLKFMSTSTPSGSSSMAPMASTSSSSPQRPLRIVSTGEALTPDVLQRWSSYCDIYNGYGPTEATIATSMTLARLGEPIYAGNLHHGLIDGLQIWILKSNPDNPKELTLAKPDEDGEIYLSGIGLALGYYGQDEKTHKLNQETFLTIAHPKHPDETLRVYRTLDAGKIDAHGYISVLGRLGRRHKIAGKLVVLDDVEAEIRDLLGPTIEEIHVDLEENEDHQKTLVAYLRLSPMSDNSLDETPTSSEASSSQTTQASTATTDQSSAFGSLCSQADWSDFVSLLSERTPYYAIPSRWYTLNRSFPTKSASGKVDIDALRSLPESDKQLQTIANTHTRPLMKWETIMATHWQEILGIHITIQAYDDFLMLGGDSFKITQLANHLCVVYHLSTKNQHELLQALLTKTRLTDMAQSLLYTQNQQQLIKSIPLFETTQAIRPPLFVIHALMGEASTDYHELFGVWASVTHGTQALYALSAHSCQGNFTADDMIPTDMDRIVVDYARTIIATQEACHWDGKTSDAPYFIAGWSAGGVIALAIGAHLRALGKEVVIQAIDSASPMLMKNTSHAAFYQLLLSIFRLHICNRYGIVYETLLQQITSTRLSRLSKLIQIEAIFSLATNLIAESPTKHTSINQLNAAKSLIIACLHMQEPSIDFKAILYIVPQTQAQYQKPKLGWQSAQLKPVLLADSLTHMSVLTATQATHEMATRLTNECHLAYDKLERKLTALNQHFLTEAYAADEHKFYIPSLGIIPNQSPVPFDVNKKIDDFIQDDHLQTLLITGNSGSGKSMLCTDIIQRYTKQYIPGSTILLYISLPTMPQVESDLIPQRLMQLGFDPTDISKLEQSHRFILILDSYDEVPSLQGGIMKNLIRSNNLDQWCTKIIITCRSNFFRGISNYQPFFMSFHHEEPLRNKFQEIMIMPFSTSQINDYVENRVSQDVLLRDEVEQGDLSNIWLLPSTYLDYFQKINGLAELIKNPFLLKICFETLPKTVLEYISRIENKEQLRIVALNLYYDFTQLWFERQAAKLIAHGNHPGTDVIADYRAFSQELAQTMTSRGVTQLIYNPPSKLSGLFRTTPPTQVTPWGVFFDNSNPDMVLARNGCPLRTWKQSGQQYYAFLHVLLQHYFVAELQLEQNLQAELDPNLDSDLAIFGIIPGQTSSSSSQTDALSSSSSASSSSTLITYNPEPPTHRHGNRH